MKKRITESQLRRMIHNAILNEVSQQAKAGSFVKAHNDIARLNKMKSNGQKTFQKNGKTFDVDNELDRRNRQVGTFGKGLAHDLSLETSPHRDIIKQNIERAKQHVAELQTEISRTGNNPYLNQELEKAVQNYRRLLNDTNGYSVHGNGEGHYSINTPNGHAYSTYGENGINYDDDNNPSNIDRLSKLHDVTDAMMGYHDELSGQMDKNMDNIRRRQGNVQALRDYEDAYRSWSDNDRRIKRSQQDYDRQPFFKKWFSQRPADGTQQPAKPQWKPNERGEYDGYFAHSNPEDYESDMNDQLQLQRQYRNARKNYFK